MKRATCGFLTAPFGLTLRSRLTFVAFALAFIFGALPAHAVAAASGPTHQRLYTDGYDDRLLLGGRWLLRLDRLDVGQTRHFERQRTTAGWRSITVPNVWNAQDQSNESMVGGVAYYRRDFRLPGGGGSATWLVRFESVNYRAKVYLNGKELGEHTGAYLPWEVALKNLRHGVNRLVVRVDSRRTDTDFPPSRFNDNGKPVGGWWNYGGLNREVYLRRVAGGVDYGNVQVRPIVNPAAPSSARVEWSVAVHNWGDNAKQASVRATFGGSRIGLGSVRVGPGGTRTLTRTTRIARPHLWSPSDPFLYPVHLRGTPGGYTLHIGVRSVEVTSDGRLLLNGQPTHFRGVGVHEDSPVEGSAVDNTWRDQWIADAKEIGATAIRAHYPLSPHLLELADREGFIVWSEIPVYAMRTQALANRSVRRAAFDYLQSDIADNQDHPSIFMWSVGNELPSRPSPPVAAYIRQAAATGRHVDPTRPVGIDIVGYPDIPCQRAYNRLQIIGFGNYFGWYTGPAGQLADRDLTSEYMDSLRACYPNKAIIMSEFGAEANRDGPKDEKGTYAFQNDWITYQLGVMQSKSWLSGAFYWTLREFRVRPGWDGGNPKPDPPLHEKGVETFDGQRKPAFSILQQAFQQTQQYG